MRSFIILATIVQCIIVLPLFVSAETRADGDAMIRGDPIFGDDGDDFLLTAGFAAPPQHAVKKADKPNQLPGAPSGVKVDPQGSWLNFVRHSSASQARRKRKHKKKKVLRGGRGPTGPRGPRGPAGPPGAEVTSDELMVEFRQMVKEAAERRAQRLLAEKCQNSVLNGTKLLTSMRNCNNKEPVETTAFRHRLQNNVYVKKRSTVELSSYHIAFGSGEFESGIGMDPRSGRFTAPSTGIYEFVANIDILNRKPSVKQKEARNSDNVQLMICIDAVCRGNGSVKHITGLGTNSRVFTIHVTGILRLEAGQFVSVFVENDSRWTVTVRADSHFSGVLLAS
ncbi:PREDICTED: adipolin-like isoform X1 [Priapulus caudatus]|uniref:Adipolin-like isoform X1 n=1 Tax=Priapulus caudatus TaxID=37621 RepID=A0ABM1DXD4_PRICU|nr:PREDICTED: adipolin-like isoform X1 [Priapulus caudatus]